MLHQGERGLAVSLHVEHETKQKKNKFLACKTAEICERRSDDYSWEYFVVSCSKKCKLSEQAQLSHKEKFNSADLKLIK